MAVRVEKGECVPAFKKEDKLDVNKYRPVTILTGVHKVF